MRSVSDLRRILSRIDGRGYKAYRDLSGEYDFGEFVLIIDHVQADPFASPSRLRVRVAQKRAGFPNDTFSGRSRETALRDFITRRFADAAARMSKGVRATGKSGIISIDRPGQEVLERTSVFIDDSLVEARFRMGLPAFGRRVAGRLAERMIFEELPAIVEAALMYKNLDPEQVYATITFRGTAGSSWSRIPRR